MTNAETPSLRSESSLFQNQVILHHHHHHHHQTLTSCLSRRRLSSNIPSLSFSPSPSSSKSSSSSASGTPIHSLGTTQGTLTPTPAALFSHPGARLPVSSRQSSLVKWLQFLLNRSYSRPINFAAVRWTIASISAGGRNEMPCRMLQRKIAPGGVASGGVW
jgi:hypothetical protein